MMDRSASDTMRFEPEPEPAGPDPDSRLSANRPAIPSRRIHIAGAPIDLITLSETVSLVDQAIQDGRTLRHVAINAAKVVEAQKHAELRRALVESQVATADGQAIVWAARALGYEAPERVAGIDLMAELLDLARRRHVGVYLLGAKPEVVGKLAQRLSADRPGLRICGYHHGYFTAAEEQSVVEDIRESRAAMLFVAMNTPAKELFLAKHHDALGIPFRMGVGGAFDVMVGLQRRAPVWMQNAGLEWFYRFLQEPGRLWRRYLVGNYRFLALVWRELKRTRLSH